jgi:hypothetical protein
VSWLMMLEVGRQEEEEGQGIEEAVGEKFLLLA